MTVHQIRPGCPDCGKQHTDHDADLVAEQVRVILAEKTPAEVERMSRTLEALAAALRAELTK